MISKDAIDRVVELIEAARGPRILEGSVRLIPPGAKIHDTEDARPFRNRYRGRFTTGSMSAFIAYVVSRVETRALTSIKESLVKVFVAHDRLRASAVFNLGNEDNPGHGDDVAVLDLEKTPEYEAICALPANLIQPVFVDWIRDWGHMARFGTVATDAEGVETVTTIPAHRAIAAVRSVQVKQTTDTSHEVSDMAAKRTKLEEIEASSRSQALPTLIECGFRPAEDLRHVSVQLRVSLAGGEKPTFSIRPVGAAALREEIAKDFEASLGAGLAAAGVAGIEIFRGTFTP